MDEREQRIVEGLAHAKDAKVVLAHIELKADSPAEAGAHAEILAAQEMLANGIEKLESAKADSERDRT